MDEKPVTGGQAEVEQREREWLEKVYQGGRQPEVTLRTLILGVFIGAILSLSNLYVGFKTG